MPQSSFLKDFSNERTIDHFLRRYSFLTRQLSRLRRKHFLGPILLLGYRERDEYNKEFLILSETLIRNTPDIEADEDIYKILHPKPNTP